MEFIVRFLNKNRYPGSTADPRRTAAAAGRDPEQRTSMRPSHTARDHASPRDCGGTAHVPRDVAHQRGEVHADDDGVALL